MQRLKAFRPFPPWTQPILLTRLLTDDKGCAELLAETLVKDKASHVFARTRRQRDRFLILDRMKLSHAKDKLLSEVALALRREPAFARLQEGLGVEPRHFLQDEQFSIVYARCVDSFCKLFVI